MGALDPSFGRLPAATESDPPCRDTNRRDATLALAAMSPISRPFATAKETRARDRVPDAVQREAVHR